MTICYDVFWSSSPRALIIYTTYTPSLLLHPSTRDISLALLYDDDEVGISLCHWGKLRKCN